MTENSDTLHPVRDPLFAPESIAQEAIRLTEELLQSSRARLSRSEQFRGRKMERMLNDEPGKSLTLQLADQVFRSKSAREQAREFQRLLCHHGIPRYLWWWERGLMYFGSMLSRAFPRLVMPLVESYIKAESKTVIKPGENKPLRHYIAGRRENGFAINLNILGEAVLGEDEATRRLEQVITRLENPGIHYISVKISAIYSQINLIAFEDTLLELEIRLRRIYRIAQKNAFKTEAGSSLPRFVNLDMEDYRDFHLTLQAFMRVLSEPEFFQLEAGIVLQAYLPDSVSAQKTLTRWAQERMEKGGGGIKIRLVKGANLAMEQIEASIHGWEQAPYDNKPDSDANFKRMVRFGCEEKNAKAVRIGVGSHNLFDISYAMLCAEANGVADRIEFEMLEGMANHQASALLDKTGALLLYSPVVDKRHFHSALAYLVRRLDENTSEENYLRHMFLMMPGTPAWKLEKAKFLESCARSESVSSTPRRTQNRLAASEPGDQDTSAFSNSPDTDWCLPANREWITGHMDEWINKHPEPVPMQTSGQFRYNDSTEVTVRDPSRPGHCAYKHTLAGLDDVEHALKSASAAWPQWNNTPFVQRADILQRASRILESERGETIGFLILDGAKAVHEADSEISEAIDFANYYSRLNAAEGIEDCEFKGRGVVVVAPPWNFPYAIPAGGVLAALAAGNTVILKPSLHTVLTSYRLACQLWEAGIPLEALQFLPCPDDDIGRALITDPRVDTVVLTGAYQTGKLFKKWRPDLHLIAETSGKNAMVITAASDAEQAASDLVQSAFGHSGQKCSAASLALVETQIYEREDFRRQLRDAARSLHVGSAWDRRSVLTPLVDPPGKDLIRALTTLEEGEQWLLKPQCIDDNPQLWSPGIKTGIQPDGWFANTECFGPVLGIISVKDLDEAIAIQNSGNFGLTGGIQSLNPEEISKWSREVRLGNAYINRSITGAIVNRQPFGGWGHSSFGPGAKAGGPDYVMNFAHWMQVRAPKQNSPLTKEVEEALDSLCAKKKDGDVHSSLIEATGHYQWAFTEVFSKSHDPSNLLAERNDLQYEALPRVIYRIEKGDIFFQAALAALASAITGIPLELSLPEGSLARDISSRFKGIHGISVCVEEANSLSRRLVDSETVNPPGILRTASNSCLALHEAANRIHIAVVGGEVLGNGRLELRHWFREKCVTETTHRYGNVLPRFRQRQ